MPRSHPRLVAALFYFTFSSVLIEFVFADLGGRLGFEGGRDGRLGIRRGVVGGHHGLRESGVGWHLGIGRVGLGQHIHGWDRSSSSSYSVGEENR